MAVAMTTSALTKLSVGTGYLGPPGRFSLTRSQLQLKQGQWEESRVRHPEDLQKEGKVQPNKRIWGQNVEGCPGFPRDT